MANTNFDVRFDQTNGWADLIALASATNPSASLGKTTVVTVTWQAFVAAGTQVVGDLTLTATGAFTAAQCAQVAAGAAIGGLTSSGSSNWFIGPASGNTNVLTSTTPYSVVAVPSTSFTGAGNSAPVAASNVVGVAIPALTIYNKGSQPFFVVISPTMPGRHQPDNQSITMGIPVQAGAIGNTLSVAASASGVWAWCPYLTAYALVQN